MANDMMNRRNDMMDAMNDWFGFPRNFFDDSVVANEIHAKYDNGVLTITLPKQTAGDDDNSIQID